MLGVSSSGGLLGSSGDSMASVAPTTHAGGGGGGGGDTGGVGSNSNMFMEEDKRRIEESDRSSAGNRWPRQETMALLQIRSDMDAAFRDSSLKGPLWEEVSRKLGELGYHRSAKKCKEKFENVYKYHKRTKDGRATKSDGKTYRFFEQLEALDQHHANSLPLLLPPPPPPPPQHHDQHHPNSVPLLPPPQKPQIPVVAGGGVSGSTNATSHVSQVIVPSIPNPTTNTTTATATTTISRNLITPPTNPTIHSPPPPLTNPTFSSPPVSNPSHPTYNPTISSPPLTHFSQQIKNPTNPSQTNMPSSFRNMPENLVSNSTSSSTSSDEHFQRRHKRKRKWTEFFEKLMKEVIEKQEDLQKKFLEAIEKREHDRMVREEAWKMQEMARMNREHEILVQERSMAAAKDAAVIAFLQKISSEQQNPMHGKMNDNSVPVLPLPQPPQPTQPQSQQQSQPPPQPPSQMKTLDIMKLDNGENSNSVFPTSSSRWPKAEVQALIQLRTTLDLKYQETGPKGPLWEEISAGMRKMGYNRNAKRCKEKWENINKYFKKVKESNKQRPEDSKTCPYFHLLDAVYKERNKMGGAGSSSYHHQSYGLNRQQESTNANMVAMMVQPEQQWPVQRDQTAVMEDMGSENMDQNHEEDDESEDDEEEDGGSYEIVSNKPSSLGGVE